MSKKSTSRLRIAAAAVLLAGAAVLGVSTSAQAATNYNYLPYPIYSAGAASGAEANNGGTGGWIDKETPGVSTTVTSNLTDLVADGKAPTLRIRITYLTSSVSVHYYELRNTSGKGEKTVSGTYSWLPGVSSATIAYQVCNGKSSTGANLYCGLWTKDYRL